MSPSPPRRRSRKPTASGPDGRNLNPKLPSVDALLSHPDTGHRSLRGVPADKCRVKFPEELLETPETARPLDRVAGQIRATRQKWRAERARMFQALRERYTERDLDRLTQMVEEEPGLVRYWQQRGELAELFIAVMLSRREHAKRRPWKPSQAEIHDFVDHFVAEGMTPEEAIERVKKYSVGARISAVR